MIRLGDKVKNSEKEDCWSMHITWDELLTKNNQMGAADRDPR